MTAGIEAQLCRMSASTINRLLRPFATTRPGSLLKSSIPIRTFADWQEERPGFLEMDLGRERSLRAPGGAFALVTTLERIRLGKNYAGHIGMRTYYVRKGLLLLSGLQIDPGWDGYLVLGLANVSPRSIYIDHGDDICSIEVHRLYAEPGKTYESSYMAEQREGKIPTSDKDYLRTIETMSVSDLTQAMYEMSANISNLTKAFWYFWIPVGLTFLAVIVGLLARLFGYPSLIFSR